MKKEKKPNAGRSDPGEAQSEEAKKFEEFTRQILSVPKEELDRREAEERRNQPDKPG